MFAPYKFEKPEAPVVADPFSLDALIAWLRTKPSGEEYSWGDCHKCALGQYREHIGHGLLGPKNYLVLDSLFGKAIHEEVGNSAHNNFNGPYTFGGALQRALAIQSRHSTPLTPGAARSGE